MMVAEDTRGGRSGEPGGDGAALPAPTGSRSGARDGAADGGARDAAGAGTCGDAADAPVRVVIADDDPLVGSSLRTILEAGGEVAVAAVGESGEEAVALYGELRPDVLLLDIRMPGMGGLAAAEQVLAADPGARVVFLTTFSDDDYIVRALRLGARGYLVKQDVGTIASALRAVMAGQAVFGPEVCERIDLMVGRGAGGSGAARGAGDGRTAGHAGVTAPQGTPAAGADATRGADAAAAGAGALAALTERERDIAALVAEGLDNREIAAALYLSEGTVRNHISVMLQKLALRNRTQLAIAWWRAQP